MSDRLRKQVPMKSSRFTLSLEEGVCMCDGWVAVMGVLTSGWNTHLSFNRKRILSHMEGNCDEEENDKEVHM